MVDPQRYRDALALDVESLVAACDDLDAPVPSCPGWAVRDLLRHLGKVQRWATACLRATPEADVVRPQGPTPGVDPRTWFRDGAAEMLDALAVDDLSAPVQTWAGERPGSWWRRRLTHETAIHRWDAQSAAGSVEGFSTWLAIDGLAEYFDEFVTVFADPSKVNGGTASVHLDVTDDSAPNAGEWYIEFGPDQVRVESTGRQSDVAVRGPAAELYLLMWKRRGLEGLEVIGDPTVFDRWQQVVVI